MSEEYEEVGECRGYMILRKKNEAGGYTYVSTELGQTIWDTCINDDSTLLFVINAERERQFKEKIDIDK